ncbi:MAG: hypothetical protein JXR71_07780 [Bacteroidales bacterium]|nr:hypothetical protein [Bacteroidales bacterium]
MKAWFFFFLLILFSLQGWAQHEKGFLSISSGPSFPIGKYSSTELNGGSFTTTGITMSVEGVWFFTNHFGVGVEAGYQQHPVDVSALATAKVNADPFLSHVVIRSDPFLVMHAAAGFHTRWYLNTKWSVTGKIMAGMLWATTPYQLYKPTYYIIGPNFYEITPSRDQKIFVVPGLGVQYKINRCLALKLETELVSRTMKFGFETSEGIRYDQKQVSFINTMAGLVILLHKP